MTPCCEEVLHWPVIEENCIYLCKNLVKIVLPFLSSLPLETFACHRLRLWKWHKSSALHHSVFKCLSPVTQSFFLFFTFFMTSIAFKVHINDNWKICPPPFFILKALGAIWWTKWVQKDQNVQVCELSGSGCSKLVELCGTRLQQVRACPGRCIGTISRMRSGHRRCHRPS